MGADECSRESGQSLLEFLLMLPLLIGITVLLVRVNTAIQISIVNQKYARQHALWLSFNSPVYPELKFRVLHFEPRGFNRMVTGVSGNPAPADESYAPEAVEQRIARTPAKAQKGPNQAEPSERTIIRVRSTVSLCTQSNVIMAGSNPQPIQNKLLVEGITPAAFAYCRSGMPEQ